MTRARAIVATLAGVSLLGLAESVRGEGDPAYGEYLANECTACHPPDVTDGVIPPLWMLPTDYFIDALRAYQTGERENPVMQAVARALGDEEIAALAAYFAYLREQKGGS